jgi:hypothetical protein
MPTPDEKPYQKLAWFATMLLITAALLTSFSIHPYHQIAFVVSSGLWTVVAWLWKERSLIVLNGTLTLIYVIGLFF